MPRVLILLVGCLAIAGCGGGGGDGEGDNPLPYSFQLPQGFEQGDLGGEVGPYGANVSILSKGETGREATVQIFPAFGVDPKILAGIEQPLKTSPAGRVNRTRSNGIKVTSVINSFGEAGSVTNRLVAKGDTYWVLCNWTGADMQPDAVRACREVVASFKVK